MRMYKTILILLIATQTMCLCSGQQIDKKKVFGGYKYSQNGTKLSLSTLSDAVKTNPKSFKLVKKAKTKAVFSILISAIGGALTGTQLGASLAGKKPNWTLIGIGVGSLGVSLPIAYSADKDIKLAVEDYNSSLKPTTSSTSANFKIIANGQGIGFAMRF